MLDKSEDERGSSVVTKFMKSLFSRNSNGINIDNATSSQSRDKIGGSLALIQHSRPPNLPAKDQNEEDSHRKQHEIIIQEIRRREVIEDQVREKKRLEKNKEEEILAADLKVWVTNVIPNFSNLRKTKEIQSLWWKGLPTAIRGRIWRLAVNNHLNLTPQIYYDCLNNLIHDENTDEILMAIELDVSRTFPTLCVFQHGGPLFESLNKILTAYCIIYKPEVGYVQGMSFIGAVLNLNMEPSDAFICFSNILNNPCHKAAFTLNQTTMNVYYKIFCDAFSINLPQVYLHFVTCGLTPDFYLLEWLYTIYAKAMPLDVVCRIWDLFIRDGDEFLFRTALGVLHLYQEQLLEMDFVHGAQFLIKLPNDLNSNALFESICKMNISIDDNTLTQMLYNVL